MAAVYLRLEQFVGLGDLVGGDRARRVHLAHLLAFGAGEGEELLEQAGLAQGDLAVVGVQVQGAALVARVGAGLAVVDGDRETVPLQDAGSGGGMWTLSIAASPNATATDGSRYPTPHGDNRCRDS